MPVFLVLRHKKTVELHQFNFKMSMIEPGNIEHSRETNRNGFDLARITLIRTFIKEIKLKRNKKPFDIAGVRYILL